VIDFVKHLPPSASLPRVLVLDEQAAGELPPELELLLPAAADSARDSVDAIVGYSAPTDLNRWFSQLRPGGRLILAAHADPQSLLQHLTESGFIHCLVETSDGLTLYRGERPPVSRNRVEALADTYNPNPENQNLRFIFLLISQIPNKPAWRLAPDEKVQWQAATLIDPKTQQPTLLAFASLVKAVAFMQPAILAQRIGGVNKIGKFPVAAAHAWHPPLTINPIFTDWQSAELGPMLEVDPRLAIAGEE
jgi:hypothetical protein